MAQTGVDASQVYRLALAAGFSDSQARTMTAIAKLESGYNYMSHNPNASTGDNSYGLWQINMLGAMGPERREALGLKSNDALYDPQTNARAAKYIFDQQGFDAWSVYKNRNSSSSAKQKWAQATATANQAALSAGMDTRPIPKYDYASGGTTSANIPAGGSGNLLDDAGNVISAPVTLAGKVLGALNPLDFMKGIFSFIKEWAVRFGLIIAGFVILVIFALRATGTGNVAVSAATKGVV